jgi:hypothetical protein
MNRLVALFALAALAIVPSVARSSSMSPSMVGVGPHGYDWLIGTWACKNSMPSPMGGPAATTLTVSRATNGSLAVHVNGTNFDAVGYVTYSPKTKTWWNPSALATGDTSTESSQQTGKKTVWTGPFHEAAAGKSMPIRDTYTLMSPTIYHDLSEAQIGGAWKTVGNVTCTKS